MRNYLKPLFWGLTCVFCFSNCDHTAPFPEEESTGVTSPEARAIGDYWISEYRMGNTLHGEILDRRYNSWYDAETKQPITTLTIPAGGRKHAIFKWNFWQTNDYDNPWNVRDGDLVKSFLQYRIYDKIYKEHINITKAGDVKPLWIAYKVNPWYLPGVN